MNIQSLLLSIFLIIGLFMVLDAFTLRSFTLEGARELREQAIDRCGGEEGFVSIEHVRSCSKNNPIEKFQVSAMQWAFIILFAVPIVVLIVFFFFTSSFVDKLITKEEKSKSKSKSNSLIIEETVKELQAYLIKNDGKVAHKIFYVKLDKLARAIQASDLETFPDNYIDLVDVGLRHLEEIYKDDDKTIEKKKTLYEY